MTDYPLARAVRAIASHLRQCKAGIPDPADIWELADAVARLEEELDARRYVESVSYRVEWTAERVQSWEALSMPGASRMRAEAPTWKELAAQLRRLELKVVTP